MLEVIKYLRENGQLDSLQNNLHINFYRHDTLPLVGLKYNQIDSPKTHPIVREARGIVLEEGSWNLVCKGFNRFFNYGEHQEEFKQFNWNDYHALVKHDGSLFLLYYYQGWRVNTSGSFANGPIHKTNTTWSQLFWQLAEPFLKIEKLNPNCTYVFELCTLQNKVVRAYPESSLFLLSVFENTLETSDEYTEEEIDEIAKFHGLQRPEKVRLTNEQAGFDLLNSYNKDSPTFEGLVIRDNNNLRYKWKTASYVALHNLFSNGAMYFPDRLVDISRAGEGDEVSTYFPEIKKPLEHVKKYLTQEFEKLQQLWNKNQHHSIKKEFAISIKDEICPTKNILFIVWDERNRNSEVNINNILKNQWNQIDAKKMITLYPQLTTIVKESLSD